MNPFSTDREIADVLVTLEGVDIDGPVSRNGSSSPRDSTPTLASLDISGVRTINGSPSPGTGAIPERLKVPSSPRTNSTAQRHVRLQGRQGSADKLPLSGMVTCFALNYCTTV
jgi:hypothetical protein